MCTSQQDCLTVLCVLGVDCEAIALEEAVSVELQHPDVAALVALAQRLELDDVREGGLQFQHELHDLIIQQVIDTGSRRNQHFIKESIIQGLSRNKHVE